MEHEAQKGSTMKLAYTELQAIIPPRCREVPLNDVGPQHVWILGSPDPADCKSFVPKTGFRYTQVHSMTGFCVHYIS
jgi:hypothetical protein